MLNLLLLNCLEACKVKKTTWLKRYFASKILFKRKSKIPLWSNNWYFLDTDSSFDFMNSDYTNIKMPRFVFWAYYMRNPFVRLFRNRQKYDTPIRFTIFNNFLDKKLRYGGSYLAKINDKYLLM